MSLAILSPHSSRAVRGDSGKVVVGCQQHELVPDAKLSEQGVDGADLHAGPTAAIAQIRGVDVILPVRCDERQRREPLDDVFARTRAGESLQQFLQDQSRSHDDFTDLKGAAKRAHRFV